MSEVTGILSRIEQGDPAAAEQLLPLVYDELRRLAALRLAKEQPGQTLQPTALVHEAYLRLVRPNVGSPESGIGEQPGSTAPLSDRQLPTPGFDSRGHFFAAAAEAMRRILVERARKQRRREELRGPQIPLEDLPLAAPWQRPEVLELNEALGKLEAADPVAANLVKLRFFAGLTIQQAASALGLPLRTAQRNWTYARTFLHRELERAGE